MQLKYDIQFFHSSKYNCIIKIKIGMPKKVGAGAALVRRRVFGEEVAAKSWNLGLGIGYTDSLALFEFFPFLRTELD